MDDKNPKNKIGLTPLHIAKEENFHDTRRKVEIYKTQKDRAFIE